LHRATEIDDAGREALLALLLTPKGGGEGVVSLEGLDVTILDLSGRLVFGQEHDFLLRTIKRLLSEGKKKILMNMAGVSYTDSTTIGWHRQVIEPDPESRKPRPSQHSKARFDL
jgi:hypothetical protein